LAFLIRPPFARVVRRAAGLACLILVGTAGAALADCPPPPVSTPFAQWGDTNSYFPVPGGSFEGAATTWSLSNASLSAGNEPFDVNDPGDSQSLTIAGNGSATSPYFCVDNTMSSLRLFAEQVSAGGDLQIAALVPRPDGVVTVPVADLADGSMPAWAPTQPITGDSSQLGDSVMVALRFSVTGSAGAWAIDDVYVDPYRSG
jgi:hypothetical protein